MAGQVALPDVAEGQRFEVTALGAPGCYAVLCRLGYADGLSKDAALIDALVAAIAEELRFAAMVAKCGRSAPCLPVPFHKETQHHAARNMPVFTTPDSRKAAKEGARVAMQVVGGRDPCRLAQAGCAGRQQRSRRGAAAAQVRRAQ